MGTETATAPSNQQASGKGDTKTDASAPKKDERKFRPDSLGVHWR
jgi:hypothetical protein